MNLSNPGRFRRQVAGVAMIALAVVLVLAELLHARFEMEAADQIAAVAENTDRWYAAHVLVLTALALAVPAFMGLAHLLRRSRPTLGHVSLVVFVPGLVALAAAAGMEFVLWQMAQPAANRDEMVALGERLNESAGIVPLFAAVLLFPLAWLLVGIGLYLARAVPVYAAVLVAVSQPIGFAGELSGGPKVLAVGAQVAFAFGIVTIGLGVLRQTDEEWERSSSTPDAMSAAV